MAKSIILTDEKTLAKSLEITDNIGSGSGYTFDYEDFGQGATNGSGYGSGAAKGDGYGSGAANSSGYSNGEGYGSGN